jgi:hypothetical protein
VLSQIVCPPQTSMDARAGRMNDRIGSGELVERLFLREVGTSQVHGPRTEGRYEHGAKRSVGPDPDDVTREAQRTPWSVYQRTVRSIPSKRPTRGA